MLNEIEGMKKIVHIYWGLSFGGIETMLVNIANAQAMEDADINVIIINDLYEPSLIKSFNGKVHIHYLHRKVNSYNIWFMIKLNYILYHIKPDIIHLHASELFKLIIDHNLSRKACVTLHALPIGLIKRRNLFSYFFPLLDLNNPGNVTFINQIPKVFAISQSVKDALLKDYGIKSVIVNNGIITDCFKRRCFNKEINKFRIVQVSRLEHDKKGQDLLVLAAAKLGGKVEVDFIGDGDSMVYLKQLVLELNANEYIHFLGRQTQTYISNHLCDYDLFVQPSRWEGFGLTVAEAMAAQVPVLVSTGQGPAEVIRGEKYGWIFENGDADSLSNMIDFICTHYDVATEKAKDAALYVKELYDVSITAKKYLEYYN